MPDTLSSAELAVLAAALGSDASPWIEDSALLAVFAARGLGVFPVSRLGADDVGLMRGLRLLGSSDGVKEEIHAIRSRRGQHHPLVMQVVAAARP